MGEKHIARLEPVGIEMEVDEDETILDAAFRQGMMLMHGCKEGQCSACKSFLLDGEVDLDRYSTFALPDFEEAEGYTLLCRAHALTRRRDRAAQLRRGGAAQRRADRRGDAEVEAVEELTHDIRRLVLQAARARRPLFNAGPVHGHRDPRAPRASTARSRWPTRRAQPDRLEFMIKLYEGGHFSGLLRQRQRHHGRRRADVHGPYGVFTLRDTSPRRLVFIAGGAGHGADPVAAALDGREGHRAAGDLLLRRAHGRPTCSRSTRSSGWPASCPTSRSSPRCPRPTATAAGTARPA